jgi:hypothetical protein
LYIGSVSRISSIAAKALLSAATENRATGGAVVARATEVTIEVALDVVLEVENELARDQPRDLGMQELVPDLAGVLLAGVTEDLLVTGLGPSLKF